MGLNGEVKKSMEDVDTTVEIPVILTDDERRLELNKNRANKLIRQAMREVLKIEEKLENLGRDEDEVDRAGEIASVLMDASRSVRSF